MSRDERSTAAKGGLMLLAALGVELAYLIMADVAVAARSQFA
jgi:hypothetical protein